MEDFYAMTVRHVNNNNLNTIPKNKDKDDIS